MSSSGFPLRLVERFHPPGLWRGRRGAGRALADARYIFAGASFSGIQVLLSGEPGESVQLTAHLCQRALHLVLRRFEAQPWLAGLAGGLAGGELPVEFVQGHDLLLDLEPERGTARVSAEVAGALGLSLDRDKGDLQAEAETLRGFELLLALGQVHIFQLHQGASQRAALHRSLELYQAFSRAERAHLHQVLETPVLDSGNLFSLFLKRSLGAGEGKRAFEQRQRQITWLLGQDRVDLPYNRREAAQILHSDADLDDKRFMLYGLLRDYDRDLEQGNIERLAAEVRRARQLLIFGRMSRAFHNQATLFADAVLLEPEASWRPLAAALDRVADEDALHAAAGELRLLLGGEREVPLTALEGACERFEEAVLEVQKEALLHFVGQARERVEDHGDEFADRPLPRIAHTRINARAEERLGLVEEVRAALLKARKRRAAYVVVSQRPSPTGSHLLVKINEFEEPYLGKAANLRKLVPLAGDQIYSSPDYRWLEVADHWIEAIPLFIKEEVLVVEGRESTRTVIDIAGMEESFREEMAEHWARNIRRVLESEWLCLAREVLLAGALPAGEWPGAGREEAVLEELRRRDAGAEIAALGALLGALYRRGIEEVQRLVEEEEISPFEAFFRVLQARETPRLQGVARDAALRRELFAQVEPEGDFEREVQRLRPWALHPRRPLPALHVLTTQSAGMTEGYIRTWLEESMALYNIVEAHGLHGEVESRRRFHAGRVRTLGEKVIRELGIWVEVEEAAARERIPLETAVERVVAANRSVQEELARLGMLIEYEEARSGRRDPECCDDIARTEEYLQQHAHSLEREALPQVLARNGEALQRQVEAERRAHPRRSAAEALRRIVAADEHYRADLRTYVRFAARRLTLEELDAEDPQRHLDEGVRTYLRNYQRLGKTTARKEIIAEHGLHPLSLHPLYYVRARGGGKRYHLLYTPSRVDLGARERESVESWSQWVGGADRAAARAGGRVYGLINKTVRSYDSLTEPEILKTGENASMASHFAFSNALSLMVTAARHGDIEEMGDQMSRRRDRLVHPAGEAYGGYCVPKDGLFLEFVLTLGRAEKLRQLGVPPEARAGLVEAAHILLDRRGDFATQLEWEAWAAEHLGGHQSLAPYFSLRRGLPVFQITRIACVLDELGQPELKDPYRVATSLAARWGIHKMVAGGEHVNRFMPFFKTWLLRQGLVEAAARHPGLPIAAARPVVVLSPEYKPDTQDGRFSAGMRKFEILCGTGAHLLRALDAEGQELAALLSEGAGALRGRGERVLRLLGVDPDDHTQVEAVEALFPAPAPPAEIRLVSPTGLSTQDLLNYTGDTRLEAIAGEVEHQLQQAGLSLGEIEANVHSYGAQLPLWAHQAPLEPAEKEALEESLGGRLHALALKVAGPERRYERALQGADVLDTGIPHRELLELLDDPARVCDLMLEGNPHSALVIVDGASGARRRAMNRLDVMLWFAAGERREREAVYLGIGLGRETVESWRAAMRRRRRRAQLLGRELQQRNLERARALYRRILAEVRREEEVRLQLDEAEKLRRFGRGGRRDQLLGRELARLGDALEELSFSAFLALGGLFLLDGRPEEEIRAYRGEFEAALAALSGAPPAPARPLEALVRPRHRPRMEEFRQERGVESSNKAVEERPAAALEARSALAARIARARALNQRQAAFSAVDSRQMGFAAAYDAARKALGPGDRALDEAAFGTFAGHARHALLALVDQFRDEERDEEARAFILRLSQLFTGREIDLEIWRQIAGGYEDIGDFGRLAQQGIESARRGGPGLRPLLSPIARGAELFYILLALESTIEFTRQEVEQVDTGALWRRLADFFAETINDHFYEYRPWIYARGIGFADYRGEELYALSVEHHAWLYRYLRFVVTHYTEVRHLGEAEQDLLLGNFLDGRQVEALGAGGQSRAERAWRSYGQLREMAFIRNDGFSLPAVFAEFDPELIRAGRRVNHVIALPVGRTHYSRALCEGPTLARQLEKEGRPGANLLIGRQLELVEGRQWPRPVVQVESAHFYVEAAVYREALVRHKGHSAAEAGHLAAAVPPKGIRLAARFTRPLLAALVYPFHGDPLYTSGKIEDCGLPYSVQSLFHTWTTYDKAKYPDIFGPESGVEMPAEIDWLSAGTARAADEAMARNWIEKGLEEAAYPGLRAFARRHRLVVIKDAAESGGRNARAFVLRRLDGSLDEKELETAVEFVYQISLRHNVSIQEVILASPEYWATEEFIDSFVRRQIVEWGRGVERRLRPRTPIYGSHRIILSTEAPEERDLDKKWHISHWITLNSTQLITNVGRGGSLEQLLPEYIRAEHRRSILDKLAAAGRRVMEALAAYEQRAAAQYERQSGRRVGADLMGVSYGMPRYMMLDFLVAPVFDPEGVVVDVRPRFDEAGRRVGSVFLLQDGQQQFEGRIADWRVVLIEPNIGVGLWDRLGLREEAQERRRAPEVPDWERVGANARIVLSDLSRAGEQYLQSLLGKDAFAS